MKITNFLRQLSCLTACALLFSLAAFCSNRGGSDYGGSPTPCTNTAFAGGTAVCGYFNGTFGSGTPVDDTLFQFELTNSSLSVASATIQFAPGAVLTDFGFVECPLQNATNTPCTTQLNPAVSFTVPTDNSGKPLLAANGTLLVSFSNFSGVYSGSNLTQGVTIFFDEPSATAPFATVSSVTTSATSSTPEPASFFLIGLTLAGFAVAGFRKRTAVNIRG